MRPASDSISLRSPRTSSRTLRSSSTGGCGPRRSRTRRDLAASARARRPRRRPRPGALDGAADGVDDVGGSRPSLCPSWPSCPSSPWLRQSNVSASAPAKPSTCGRTRTSPSACCCPATRAARCGSPSCCSTRRRCSTTTAGCGATRARRRRRAADDPEHRHGRPERRDRLRGADRARRPPDRPRRDLRRARRAACGSATLVARRGRAGRGRREPRARRRRHASPPDAALHARAAPPRRTPAPASSCPPTSSTTRIPTAPRAGLAAGAIAVEMEAATLFAVAERTAWPRRACSAVSDIVSPRERIGADALEPAEAVLGASRSRAARRHVTAGWVGRRTPGAGAVPSGYATAAIERGYTRCAQTLGADRGPPRRPG